MQVKIGNIKKPLGIIKKNKRKGRGIGSGRGKTSGRGSKGAKARSGSGGFYLGFEGGQMSLVRRLPKRGFTNKFKKEWAIVNIGSIAKLSNLEKDAIVNRDILYKNRLIRNKRLPIKILGNGKLERAVNVEAEAFSGSAKKAIENVGGKVLIARSVTKC
ncbi:Ribosomal protein L15, bacterial-type [Candidatus Omnitrophus magneticus]|uniref:Large ribosomal subunit protein uL15 n=1 Tax=Candidatus Omnitrophus magneticus TaxID=1609969 RepID=A0A0F0CS57_9BACT|nr:Ribosomal protein L15, bacterial-type [Candidatus Omnitrophus magneticus]